MLSKEHVKASNLAAIVKRPLIIHLSAAEGATTKIAPLARLPEGPKSAAGRGQEGP